MECSATSENGLLCQKPMYHARNGEYWDHAGGHIFAKKETIEAIETMHFDAKALLAGEKAAMHSPEDCPHKGFCSWR